MAVATNRFRLVPVGKLLKKYSAGWAAPAGHSASDRQAASGTFPADNLWAGRTRQAANQPVTLPFDPSRPVTERNASARASAHSLTLGEVAPPARPPVGSAGGRGPTARGSARGRRPRRSP